MGFFTQRKKEALKTPSTNIQHPEKLQFKIRNFRARVESQDSMVI